MLRLEITGENVADLYVNGVNVLLLLTRGGNTMFPVPGSQEPSGQQEPPPGNPPHADQAGASEPQGDVTRIEPPIAAPTPNKRTPKNKAKAAVVEETDPFGLGAVPPGKQVEALTLDTMKTRVKDILAEHAERGNSPADCIAYVRKLFEPFKIKLSAELKPEQFEEFYAASQGYLDGTAPE